mmetsp:Transcript_40492/g.120787  ORF Transcript_40492/g.120787 Transcript_40492/m.120787 type:complete len:447 (-) Transcript_40492:628-1968(-)
MHTTGAACWGGLARRRRVGGCAAFSFASAAAARRRHGRGLAQQRARHQGLRQRRRGRPHRRRLVVVTQLRLLHRQQHHKPGALVDLRVDHDLPVVRLDQLLDQVQPEARTAVPPRRRHVGLLKRAKDGRDLGLHDAHACVLHRHKHVLVVVRDAGVDGDGARRRELRRVAHEVVQDLHDAVVVADDDRHVADLVDQPHAAPHQRQRQLEDVVDEALQVDAQVLDHDRALLHLRGVKDVVDELQQALAGQPNRRHGVVGLFAHVARRPRQQRVRQPDDPVERRAQLVRHGRQKVVLALDRLGQLLNRVQPVRLLHRLHHILAPLRDREEVGLHEAGRVHHLGDPVEHRPHRLDLVNGHDPADADEVDDGEAVPCGDAEEAYEVDGVAAGGLADLRERRLHHAPHVEQDGRERCARPEVPEDLVRPADEWDGREAARDEHEHVEHDDP